LALDRRLHGRAKRILDDVDEILDRKVLPRRGELDRDIGLAALTMRHRDGRVSSAEPALDVPDAHPAVSLEGLLETLLAELARESRGARATARVGDAHMQSMGELPAAQTALDAYGIVPKTAMAAHESGAPQHADVGELEIGVRAQRIVAAQEAPEGILAHVRGELARLEGRLHGEEQARHVDALRLGIDEVDVGVGVRGKEHRTALLVADAQHRLDPGHADALEAAPDRRAAILRDIGKRAPLERRL